MADTVYRFAFDPRVRPLLRLFAITDRTAGVRLGPGGLLVRYGAWRLSTPVANVLEARITGPYALWKAVGPRVSAADRGVTFGTSAGPGVCLLFAEPVRGAWPTAWPRHPGCTLTLAEPAAFVAHWRSLAEHP